MNYSIKFIQSELTKLGLKPGAVDGVLGKKTLTALNKVKELPKSWNNERKMVGLIQLIAQKENIEAGKIDGLWGFTNQLCLRQSSRIKKTRGSNRFSQT